MIGIGDINRVGHTLFAAALLLMVPAVGLAQGAGSRVGGQGGRIWRFHRTVLSGGEGCVEHEV
jgi:hypothetical protein